MIPSDEYVIVSSLSTIYTCVVIFLLNLFDNKGYKRTPLYLAILVQMILLLLVILHWMKLI